MYSSSNIATVHTPLPPVALLFSTPYTPASGQAFSCGLYSLPNKVGPDEKLPCGVINVKGVTDRPVPGEQEPSVGDEVRVVGSATGRCKDKLVK